MMRALLIAEKPSLKRTIEAVYNKHRSEIPYEIKFMEQRGHLITLKTPDEMDETLKTWSWDNLPIHPEEHGGWQYKIIQDKKVGTFLTAKERYIAIKKELDSGNYDFVINAGDPDQEGELLIRIVLASMRNKLPVKRYWSNATTEIKVLEALKNLRDDDHEAMLTNLLLAAYGRQHSDYRFGMNLSRAASLKMGSRVACGRVKTPILSIVCRREKEIANFKPSTSYGVKAEYEEGFNGQLFDNSLISEMMSEESTEKTDENANLIWFDSESEAKQLISKLSSTAKVVKSESKRVESYAPKLFKLATIQIAAGRLGYTAAQTLSIIQKLYDSGYLTYPRTGCEYISSSENLSAMLESASCVPELEPYIKSIDPSVIKKVRGTKKWVNDKMLQESGHSALVPTTSAPDFSALSNEEKNIYTLICRQFVAIFLPPLIQDKTLLITDINGYTFKSTGKALVDAGYTKIFDTKFSDMVIPVHKENDVLDIKDFDTVSKTTTCPKRFTDAELIKVCEAPHKFLHDTSLKSLGKHLKIGTDATRASIIEELIVRDKYLQRSKEKKTVYIVPTKIGMTIYENLKDCDICKVDLTGKWELQLDKVRKGELELSELESDMKQHIERLIKDIKDASMTAIKVERAVVTQCPSCGKEIISGPKGFYCSGYKEGCKIGTYKAICDSIITDAEFSKLVTGQTIRKVIKKGTYKWEQQLSYNAQTQKIEFIQTEDSESSYLCPKCGTPLKENDKVARCSDECGFVFWKTVCGKILTKEQISKFFSTGSTGLISGLKSKAGKSFKADIVLKYDKSGTEFKFPERK